MNRRTWLGVAAASTVLGANDRVVVGLIGCGGRGRYVAQFMSEAPGVEFGGVADVYEPNAVAAQQWAGPRCKAYKDFRHLLENKDIDCVVVATPDHWHAAPTVLACAAGKDVYVEKPLSYCILEGRKMVEAARRSNRIVQSGTQHRASPHFAECARIVQSGEIGKVHFVRIWNYVNLTPNGIGKEPDGDPPPGLDWDFYCGPAPLRPYNRKRFLATYRYFWDYSGGYITDFGTHRFDTVHQVMGVDKPLTVAASGGRFVLDDAGEVPDFLQVTYEYPGFVLSYEGCNYNGLGMPARSPGMRYYNARGPFDRPNGMAFYGTLGTLFADRLGYEIFPELKPGSSTEFRCERRFLNVRDATREHAQNFIENVRTRKQPEADLLVGHRAVIPPHLGNIALKTGLKLRWDAEKEDFIDVPEASRLRWRQPRKPWDLI